MEKRLVEGSIVDNELIAVSVDGNNLYLEKSAFFSLGFVGDDGGFDRFS